MPAESNYALVEGPWKQFTFRRVTEKDYASVLSHIAEHFVRDEPTSKLMGYSKEFADDFNGAVKKALPHGMSFIAEDSETKEIAAVRITFHHNSETNFDDLELNSRQAKMLFKLLDDLEREAGPTIHNEYHVHDWAEFFVISTNPKYRNNGLAGEFYDRSIQFLKAEGFKHALVVVTSPYTKTATKKRGFEELSRVDYDQFNDYEGKRVFQEGQVTPDHFACCMWKVL